MSESNFSDDLSVGTYYDNTNSPTSTVTDHLSPKKDIDPDGARDTGPPTWENHVNSFPEHMQASLRLYNPMDINDTSSWTYKASYPIILRLMHPEHGYYRTMEMTYDSPCSFCNRETSYTSANADHPCFDIWSKLSKYTFWGVIALIRVKTDELYPRKYWSERLLRVEGEMVFRAVYSKKSKPTRWKRFCNEFFGLNSGGYPPLYLEDLDLSEYVVHGEIEGDLR